MKAGYHEVVVKAETLEVRVSGQSRRSVIINQVEPTRRLSDKDKLSGPPGVFHLLSFSTLHQMKLCHLYMYFVQVTLPRGIILPCWQVNKFRLN